MAEKQEKQGEQDAVKDIETLSRALQHAGVTAGTKGTFSCAVWSRVKHRTGLKLEIYSALALAKEEYNNASCFTPSALLVYIRVDPDDATADATGAAWRIMCSFGTVKDVEWFQHCVDKQNASRYLRLHSKFQPITSAEEKQYTHIKEHKVDVRNILFACNKASLPCMPSYINTGTNFASPEDVYLSPHYNASLRISRTLIPDLVKRGLPRKDAERAARIRILVVSVGGGGSGANSFLHTLETVYNGVRPTQPQSQAIVVDNSGNTPVASSPPSTPTWYRFPVDQPTPVLDFSDLNIAIYRMEIGGTTGTDLQRRVTRLQPHKILFVVSMAQMAQQLGAEETKHLRVGSPLQEGPIYRPTVVLTHADTNYCDYRRKIALAASIYHTSLVYCLSNTHFTQGTRSTISTILASAAASAHLTPYLPPPTSSTASTPQPTSSTAPTPPSSAPPPTLRRSRRERKPLHPKRQKH